MLVLGNILDGKVWFSEVTPLEQAWVLPEHRVDHVQMMPQPRCMRVLCHLHAHALLFASAVNRVQS